MSSPELQAHISNFQVDSPPAFLTGISDCHCQNRAVDFTLTLARSDPPHSSHLSTFSRDLCITFVQAIIVLAQQLPPSSVPILVSLTHSNSYSALKAVLNGFLRCLGTKSKLLVRGSNFLHDLWPACLWSHFRPSTISVGPKPLSAPGTCWAVLLWELWILLIVLGTTSSPGCSV